MYAHVVHACVHMVRINTTYTNRTCMLHIDTSLKRIFQRIRDANLVLTISRATLMLLCPLNCYWLLPPFSPFLLLPSSRFSFTTRKREVRVRVSKLCNRERSREAGRRDKPIPRPVASVVRDTLNRVYVCVGARPHSRIR